MATRESHSLCSQLADMYPAMLSNWAATIQDSSLQQRAFAALAVPRGG